MSQCPAVLNFLPAVWLLGWFLFARLSVAGETKRFDDVFVAPRRLLEDAKNGWPYELRRPSMPYDLEDPYDVYAGLPGTPGEDEFEKTDRLQEMFEVFTEFQEKRGGKPPMSGRSPAGGAGPGRAEGDGDGSSGTDDDGRSRRRSRDDSRRGDTHSPPVGDRDSDGTSRTAPGYGHPSPSDPPCPYARSTDPAPGSRSPYYRPGRASEPDTPCPYSRSTAPARASRSPYSSPGRAPEPKRRSPRYAGGRYDGHDDDPCSGSGCGRPEHSVPEPEYYRGGPRSGVEGSRAGSGRGAGIAIGVSGGIGALAAAGAAYAVARRNVAASPVDAHFEGDELPDREVPPIEE